MHDPLRVREEEAVAHVLRDLERARQRQRPLGPLEQALDIPAAEQLRHDVRRAALLADLEDRDDVRVCAHASHRLRLAHDALATGRI